MKQKNGFTIIELLVSIGIFSMVIVMAIGLFANILNVQRRSIAIQDVQDNGRYLMGFIVKEIRMSEISDYDGESSSIDIIHSINGNITYSFTGTDITRNGEQLNSDEVNVSGKFFIDGKTVGDEEQPKITITMKVETISAKTAEVTSINLQTTLSQRKLDI